MFDTPALWIGFNFFIILMVALDLGIFHRKAHVVAFKEAIIWTSIWIALSLVFNLLIYSLGGSKLALEFLTGYLLEKSLSLDNIFIIALLFSTLGIPLKYQHRVLFWGISGALVMRGLMIFIGIELIEKFNWMIYVFGIFLVFSAIQTMRSTENAHGNAKIWLNQLEKWVPMTQHLHGEKFLVKKTDGWKVTPLFLALLMIEFADVIFAIDSIPAILAVSRDKFIVYTSNVFAILGLRSMYFLLANIIPRFYYLKHAMSFILGFVGLKMIVIEFIHIPIWISLSLMVTTFILAIALSLYRTRATNHRR